jgi:DNA invertase Pin-like site-specific DNA recombinase
MPIVRAVIYVRVSTAEQATGGTSLGTQERDCRAWCERHGYEINALIHDEALAYHKPGQTPEEFSRLLTTVPDWAKGLPLAAPGGLVNYYRKD